MYDDVENPLIENEKLINDFQKLIDKNERIQKKFKKDTKLNNVDKCIASFGLFLIAQQMKLEKCYPLSQFYELLKIRNEQNEYIIKSIVETINLDLKASFVTLCGFQIENIIKQIADVNGIEIRERSSIDGKFKKVLTYLDIPLDDKLELIKIFYYTRNTLHSGYRATKSVDITYKDMTFSFIENKTIKHTNWNDFIYFVNEIIGLIEQILNSKKYFKRYDL